MMAAVWQVVAASVTGASHEKAELPCQDAHCWRELPDGYLAIAVADGAGSAALADVGAIVAARAAVDCVAERSKNLAGADSAEEARQIATAALRAAHAAVESEAAAREADIRELATTLIVVVAGPNRVAAAQVGDGAVVVAGANGRLRALTRPPEGEYANETIFLISPTALETVQVETWSVPVTHVAVFSDGLQRLALNLPKGTPHAPFFAPLFRFVATAADGAEATQQLYTFLKSPRITERADDDLTLLLAALQK